jgi:uncharacterized membrane protein YphA (DoxX/SURF4 family)
MDRVYKVCFISSMITIIIGLLFFIGVADLTYSAMLLMLNIFATLIAVSIALSRQIEESNNKNVT